MSLTHADVQKILTILERSDCEEVSLEYGDLKLHLRRRGNPPDIQHKENIESEAAAHEAMSAGEKGSAAPHSG